MKKIIGLYTVVWAICLGLFNAIVFITPVSWGNLYKFGGAFWVGYIAITIAFVGQLVCTLAAFKAKTLQVLFYSTPVISVSYTGLAVMLIVGVLTMVIPDLPNWIGILVCAAVLAVTVIAVIKAASAAAIVSAVDKKIAQKTAVIRILTAEADSLFGSVKDGDLKAVVKKVCDALRYSDPMSDPGLSELNEQLHRQFAAFKDAVCSDDLESATANADELLSLIAMRNEQCKLAK